MVTLRALDRKVLRDLWHLRGQVLAIALVIACGVAVLVMSLSTQRALLQTADAYYERYAFGDVFARLKRAPDHVRSRIAQIPGVQTVQTRILQLVTLDIAGFAEPVISVVVSVPTDSAPPLNQLVLRQGRWIESGKFDEVLVSEPFAEAHRLRVGDEFIALLNGHRRTLRVAGIALSPEFIYSLGPGALMPDDLRFGTLWMGRDAMEAAFDLERSFNDVSLRLSRGTSAEAVIPELDEQLARYGGVGAIARADQMSHWWVMNEINQLGTMSKVLPTMFLLVSSLLTNALMSRLIATERTQIGLMKAFGYRDREVGWHYCKMVVVIALLGITLGFLAGIWTGRWNTELYANSFRFPLLIYRPSLRAFLIAGGLSLVAALAGTLGTVRRAARLPPAQAMMPPRPPNFRHGRWGLARVARWLDQPTRIILRQISRAPLRSALTTGGIACALSLLLMALQWFDAIDHLARGFFYDAQRQHVMVGLTEAQSRSVVHEFEHMPSVLAVEPSRIVSADYQFGPTIHRGTVNGIPSGAVLQPIFDLRTGRSVEVPPEGLVLATRLADKLRVGIGDSVWLHVLEGRRPSVQLPVVALVETDIAMPGSMNLSALNRLLKEPPSAQYLSLLVDTDQQTALYDELKSLPEVSSIMLREAAIETFHETIAEHLLVSVIMFSVFACILGFGVSYNSARIALSERGRDLATLRVLGFTRGEVAYILLGEVGLLVLLALPLGCLLGRAMTRGMAQAFDTELFRLPSVIEPSTYGVAVLIVLAATLVSAAILRRRLNQLNLIEVLKTRE